MKKLLLLLATVAATFTANAQIENAKDAVKNMGLGWNLGNTLDANSGTGALPSEASYWNCQTLDSETCWGQPKATAELIKMMKGAGFGAIRVPVTWYNHMDADGKVDAAWMKRVHEVVDYVINEGLYCIINVHHDTGADGGSFHSWIKADKDNYSTYKDKFENLWKQIAEEFKSYDGKLLFEAYNEMLDAVKYETDKVGSWCYASFSSKNQYDADVAKSAYEGINGYAQSFVNAVRAVGGNNADRNLIINTYAAANGAGAATGWNNEHLLEPLSQMKFPEDTAKDHLIFEVHAYPSLLGKDPKDNWKEKLNTMTIDEIVDNATTYFISKGAPVIIGEWGTSAVDKAGETDYDVNKDQYFKFVDYFIKKMKENDIATFYWMGLTDGLYRGLPAFNQADLAERMAKAYHGDSFQGQYPVKEKSSEVVCFEGEKTIEWSNQTDVPADYFKDFGPNVQMTIDYVLAGEDYNMFQFYYGDWDKKNFPTMIVDGKTLPTSKNDDGSPVLNFIPGDFYDIPVGTEKSTVFTFDEKTAELLAKKGLLFIGHGIKVKKITLSEPGSSSLSNVLNDSHSTEYFNLAGQRVASPAKGFYIQGGKKVYLK